MDRNESLLQQRGPPISPICPSESAVILCDSANGSLAKGVDFEIMEIMLMYCEKMDYFTRQSDEYNIQ